MKNTNVSELEQFAATLWNREQEMEYIRNAFQIPPQEYGTIYYFYGMSGVGKSKLCEYTRRYVRAMIQTNFAMVNIDMSLSMSEAEIVRYLYGTLSKYQELSFPRYEIASEFLYHANQIASDKLENTTDGVCQNRTMSSIAADLGAYIFKLTFSEGNQLVLELATCMVNALIEKCTNKLSDECQNRMKARRRENLDKFCMQLKELTPVEVRRNLADYFAEDIRESLEYIRQIDETQGYHLVVTIDAFEKRAHTSSSENFFQCLFQKSGGVIWFLFGTETSILEKDIRVAKHAYPVSPFDANKLREYLDKRGIHSQDDQDTIISVSDGLPAAVQIMIDIYYDNKGHLDEINQLQGYYTLFNRYFSEHLTEQEQKIFLRLSLFDSWGKEEFSYVLAPDYFRQDIFDRVIQRTAFVVRSSIDDTSEGKYCLVDIVRKTLLAQMERQGEDALIDAQRVKFQYEKAVVEGYLEQLKRNVIVEQHLNEKLKKHSLSAFEAGVKCYTSKEEFEEISRWCTDTQQAMSKRGLYYLKAELTTTYLNSVEERDGFIYDTEEDERKRFRFRNTRDRIWAYRFTNDIRMAINLAGQYHSELLSKFGINYPYIPFATYLWGLTFSDAGEYETARWLLNQSILLESSIKKTTGEVNSSIYTVASNALGCIEMDLGEYKKAEESFKTAERSRSSNDMNGLKNTSNNLSRLYFRWAQRLTRTNSSPKKISQYLKSSKQCLDEYEGFMMRAKVQSITDKYAIRTRRIVLSVAENRMKGNIGKDSSGWTDYFREMEEAADVLEKNAVNPAKSILSIRHNLAVMYALQGDFKESQKRLEECKAFSKRLYGGEESVDWKKNKPAISDLEANLRVVKQCIKNSQKFNPREFLLQF